MLDAIALYRRAVEEFGSRVRAIGDDQWHLPTPNTDWDVSDLVNHLVFEDVWAPPLLAGQTIAEVGDRFEGDLLGDDPKAAWEAAARAAVAAVDEEGALARTVHISFGDVPGAEYVAQLTVDHTIHAWDLARAIGADEELDPELVEAAYGIVAPQAEAWRQGGAFGPQVELPPGASRQDQLLALTGRSPGPAQAP
ncbi:MAG TPA: TIGR03086 family metal-binding protein [Acidimicrobiales bacterium]|nr:TIGR03086 family metal-binding protein [Acidimicrobiales bacterium]